MPAGIYKRKPMSQETKNKIGLANSKPKIKIVCKICKKVFYVPLCQQNKAKYCSYKCMGISNIGKKPWNKGTKGIMKAWNKGKKCLQYSGENHWNWKGGIMKQSQGYVFAYSPNHPNVNNKGYMLEHRLVMEKKLGRYLTTKEQIHHKNHIRDDNRIRNLLLCPDNKTHLRLHYKYKLVNSKWLKYCKICKHWKYLDKFYGNGKYVSSLCKKCN